MVIKGIGIPASLQSKNIGGVTGTILFIQDLSDIKSEEVGNKFVAIDGVLSPVIVSKNAFAAAFISSTGGWSSHGVALARAHGISCIVGLGKSILNLKSGDFVKIDFIQGEIVVIKGRS